MIPASMVQDAPSPGAGRVSHSLVPVCSPTGPVRSGHWPWSARREMRKALGNASNVPPTLAVFLYRQSDTCTLRRSPQCFKLNQGSSYLCLKYSKSLAPKIVFTGLGIRMGAEHFFYPRPCSAGSQLLTRASHSFRSLRSTLESILDRVLGLGNSSS